MCGKDSTSSSLYTPQRGSPPLAREGLYSFFLVFSKVRITPARAGRTHTISLDDEICQDHPRSRGKDAIGDIAVNSMMGSPPLAREGQIHLL